MPQQRKNQPRRSRADWLSLIDRHDQSGLSGKQFCHREAISYGSFMKWRWKLKTKPVSSVNDFIELSAEPRPLALPVDEKSPEDCLLEVQVGTSVTVRIYAGR